MDINKIIISRRDFQSNDVNKNVFVSQDRLEDYDANDIYDLTVDIKGNVYLTDPVQHVVIKVSNQNEIEIFAGELGTSGNNGSSTVSRLNARFNTPKGIDCDMFGNIYIADSGNNQIRKIDMFGNVSLVAGDSDGEAGYSGGFNGKLNAPNDVVVNNDIVYIADQSNHAIRMARSNSREVYTIAGDGTPGDGKRFNSPVSLAVNKGGQIFVADRGNFKIKMISNGNVYSYAGTGVEGAISGKGNPAQFSNLKFMTSDKYNNLYVTDHNPVSGSRLLRVDSDGSSYLIKSFEEPIAGFEFNAHNQVYVAVTDVTLGLYVIGNIVIGNAVIQ